MLRCRDSRSQTRNHFISQTIPGVTWPRNYLRVIQTCVRCKYFRGKLMQFLSHPESSTLCFLQDLGDFSSGEGSWGCTPRWHGHQTGLRWSAAQDGDGKEGRISKQGPIFSDQSGDRRSRRISFQGRRKIEKETF